jgi:hypothetical protein
MPHSNSALVAAKLEKDQALAKLRVLPSSVAGAKRTGQNLVGCSGFCPARKEQS